MNNQPCWHQNMHFQMIFICTFSYKMLMKSQFSIKSDSPGALLLIRSPIISFSSSEIIEAEDEKSLKSCLPLILYYVSFRNALVALFGSIITGCGKIYFYDLCPDKLFFPLSLRVSGKSELFQISFLSQFFSLCKSQPE